jgi:5-methylcytosine-specific restriction endonuclease McrA
VQFTASSALREKLERARSLMRHRNVDGDLAVIVERALDLLLEKLQRERAGHAAKPQATPRPAKEETVTRAVRREVWKRDDGQCAYRSPTGERCPSREFLELDHRHPRGRGGDSSAGNLRLLCRAHNLHAAEEHYGREHVAHSISLRQNKHASPSRNGAPTASQDQLRSRNGAPNPAQGYLPSRNSAPNATQGQLPSRNGTPNATQGQLTLPAP